MDIDVLVVGAGPTGLMLANQLARHGVRAMIVDRHAGPARETRALGVQARTLEIYDRMTLDGRRLGERAVALGKRALGAQLWSAGRPTAEVALADAGGDRTPHAYILVLGQDENERLLGECLWEEGGDVRWNTELVGLVQHDDHVAVELATADGGRERLDVRWVAGCDGAKSAVRTLGGIDFPGAPYEHVFFVADVEMTGTMRPERVNVYLWRSGFHLFFPMRGADHWRIVGILPQALLHDPSVTFDAVVPSMRAEAGADLAFGKCSWFSTYRIHHRMAVGFRDRRTFLLGDAAHIHSPVGAQGMNTGLQDAYNLAWKLALVVQGRADATLLDSYAAERVPVARRLLDTTDRAFTFIVSDGPLAGFLRTRVLARLAAFAMRRAAIRHFVFQTVSQTGIGYRDGPLSRSLGTPSRRGPQAGDRFPWLHLRFVAGGPVEDLYARLDDRVFTLLVFGQPAPAADALPRVPRIACLAVPDDAENAAAQRRAGIPPVAFHLLRPDGHIGLCGERVDAAAVAAWLREQIGIVPAA